MGVPVMPAAAARDARTAGRSPVAAGGKARPSGATSRSVALAIATISIADLVPSRKELNIFGFMPAALARSGVRP